jgi:magnesium chelatase family protein
MLSHVKACGLRGIDGYIVQVETDISNGIPTFDMVGLGDTAVREAKERVRSAIKNSGFAYPQKRITLNLAPANVKKEGSSYDLAIAIGVLAASEQVYTKDLEQYVIMGELGLDGSIRGVRGVLSMTMTALNEGFKKVIVPIANMDEAAIVKGIEVYPFDNIKELIRHLNGEKIIGPHIVDIDKILKYEKCFDVDFSEVSGQESVKRALEVAVSGGHNAILLGSPGSGKTMMAKRLPTIMPSLSFEEAIEVTKIYSITGLLKSSSSLVTTRPFRNPHHTTSAVSLVGGGKLLKPGEISLAHYGILFLDELPEFSRDAFEILRQPLEDGYVNISRATVNYRYPSKTTLICSANPCKCGNYLEEEKECTCTSGEVRKYLGKISGPLLDRIDIHIEVGSVKYSDLSNKVKGEESSIIRNRVENARKIQLERYKNDKIFSNSELSTSLIDKYCHLDEKGRLLLRNSFEKLGLSARAHSKILKLARTLADMEEKENIGMEHVAEAISYRSLDRRFWNI